MKMNAGSRTRSRWRWVAVLLALGTVLTASAEPPSVKLPGRKTGSTEPWDAFLGRAAHTAIGLQYRAQNPSSNVFLGNRTLFYIMEKAQLGDPSRLSTLVKALRPDITDTTLLVLFEIKPDNVTGMSEGRQQASQYLAALNAVVEPHQRLTGGTRYEGALFVEFENGGALWRLSWRTPEPGVTLYRWGYRRKHPGKTWEERAAQQEEEIPGAELEKYAPVVEQALQHAYDGGERPVGFQGQVYRSVDCH